MMHIYVCSRDMCFLWSWWVSEAPTTTISWGCLLWLSQRLLLDGFRFGAGSQWIFKWSLVATKLHGTRHVDGRVPKHIFLIFGGGMGWGGACYPPCEVARDGCYAADGGGLGWGGACYPSCEVARDGCYAADGGGLGCGGACYPSCEVAQDGCYAADGEGLGCGVGHVTLRVKLNRTHGRTCVQHFLAALRVLESTAGKNFNQRCPLRGSVEVDGSFIGKFHMSANNLRHADQIQQD